MTTRLFRVLPLALACISATALASSHREAPAITATPKVDGTDLYMFRSYEAGRQDFVTILANYMPFQDPQGGPNYFMFDPNARYEIHIDNTGDGVEDLTFRFRFQNSSKATALNVGGKQVKIPLIESGQISGVNPGTLNVRETYTVDLVRGGRGNDRGAGVTKAGGGGAEFDKPVDNIGDKSFGGATAYADYAAQHIYNVTLPGCDTPGRVFVGQRKEPFYIAVGKIFDLLNLNLLGPEVGGNNNDLEGKNISTIAMELPISCITSGGEPVIGAFMTASMQQVRILDRTPETGIGRSTRDNGPWVQVSRLGMPLVNELVIGLDDKDRFNASQPRDDASNFADYVTNPALPALVQALNPGATAPTNFPRTDLVTVFLKGIAGVNQPKSVVPAEMLRLNTSIAATPQGSQSPLGVAAGDNAGFPNGRRPADDVVDLSLRVAMGALCVLTGANDALQVGCKPTDAPVGGMAFTDGVRKTAANFAASFPYVTTPLPGNLNPPAAAGTTFP
ncbi:DUF4331 domain-containing protein [Ramlibacter solisilvae]|uniref:DUF4331 domain-containing protein n=1 Tax=Ramlibacter tataouinensis TaxID=94132 RepID=A0A127JNJ6_9BURK|nr:DUF4331 domain-containing protein [Ramlibacter tataouinensis]AMO21569.1 hypothetical protein UC35_00140 [Ramlibacter tataouinensis]